MKSFNFYMDESGARNPINFPSGTDKACPWFAMGGILIRNEDEGIARKNYSEFCSRWKINYPLHSNDIRMQKKNFKWLQNMKKADHEKFHASLDRFIVNLPVVSLACVINREGYIKKYQKKYKEKAWMLCKSAFSISVERAAKYSLKQNRKLRVYPEKCNVREDKMIQDYYNDIKENGMPFNKKTSEKYKPLAATPLSEVLYELKFKEKSSPMVQVADLYLWVISKKPWASESFRPFKSITEANRIIDAVLDPDEKEVMGIKYYRFD